MQFQSQKALRYLKRHKLVYTFRSFNYRKNKRVLINKEEDRLKAIIYDNIRVLGKPRLKETDIEEFKHLCSNFYEYSGFSSPSEWEAEVYKLNKNQKLPKYLVRVDLIQGEKS